jgi:hypothetical protein
MPSYSLGEGSTYVPLHSPFDHLPVHAGRDEDWLHILLEVVSRSLQGITGWGAQVDGELPRKHTGRQRLQRKMGYERGVVGESLVSSLTIVEDETSDGGGEGEEDEPVT